MSISERRLRRKKIERHAQNLITYCREDEIVSDAIVYGYFSRKEITPNCYGFDKKSLLENMVLWGYKKDQVEKTLARLVSNKFLVTFNWRNRTVYDFAFHEEEEAQYVFLNRVTNESTFQSKINVLKEKTEMFLTTKIRDEKDEVVPSILRLLYYTALPEIKLRSAGVSVAEFHFEKIAGRNWVDVLADILANKVLMIKLNFLSSNVANEYFIPDYVRNIVLKYIIYSNAHIKRKLQNILLPPLFDQTFQLNEKIKETLLKMGFCHRKWTIPKATFTTGYVPNPFAYQLFVEELIEPEMIVKAYPDDELWTYYLIGNALVNARHNLHISSPYTNRTTLTFFVRAVPKDVDVRILTSRLGGKKEERIFVNKLREMWNEGYRIEITKILRESNRVPLHDRFLIMDNKVVLDLPGDLKRGFSGADKAEHVKWTPYMDQVASYSSQFNRYWSLNFNESDFIRDSSKILATKLSFATPSFVTTYVIHLVGGRVRKDETTISFEQFLSR